MTGPRIMSQAAPHRGVSYPGWKSPFEIKAQATVNGAAITMVAAETTVGCAITRSASGVFALTFPAAKRIARAAGNVAPVTPATAANFRMVAFAPEVVAAANAGSIVFRTVDLATPTTSDPEANSTVDVWAMVDYG
jgi:hypothetical protein